MFRAGSVCLFGLCEMNFWRFRDSYDYRRFISQSPTSGGDSPRIEGRSLTSPGVTLFSVLASDGTASRNEIDAFQIPLPPPICAQEKYGRQQSSPLSGPHRADNEQICRYPDVSQYGNHKISNYQGFRVLKTLVALCSSHSLD